MTQASKVIAIVNGKPFIDFESKVESDQIIARLKCNSDHLHEIIRDLIRSEVLIAVGKEPHVRTYLSRKLLADNLEAV